ncbi:hypothetical protein C8R44DRAFT_726325 [Mycena epipterygia]|nr:hypothetical protein C8R44DRAFT_726325 [Mycena epipterygia]
MRSSHSDTTVWVTALSDNTRLASPFQLASRRFEPYKREYAARRPRDPDGTQYSSLQNMKKATEFLQRQNHGNCKETPAQREQGCAAIPVSVTDLTSALDGISLAAEMTAALGGIPLASYLDMRYSPPSPVLSEPHSSPEHSSSLGIEVNTSAKPYTQAIKPKA